MGDRGGAAGGAGGGVGGCPILYWLPRLGWSDVVLVERADLTSGSTFHSAGLVGQLRASLSPTKMVVDSGELSRRLRTAAGLALPRRRPRGSAPVVALADEDDDGERRALPDARHGGRARDRLAGGRLGAAPRLR